MRKKNSGPAISKAIIPRTKPEHVTIDPILEQKLFDAYKAVTVDGQSIRQAAKQFGTSRTTLTKYLYGERKNKVVAHEYEMSLNVNYENKLENYIISLTSCCDYINKKSVYLLANQLLEMNGASKTKVSQSWISKFFKRHPRLNNIKPIVFQKHRSNDCYESILSQWPEKLSQLYKDKNVTSGQIYCVSETSYQMSSFDCKITYDSLKDPMQLPMGENENLENLDSITIVETICANGSRLEPFMVLHGKVLTKLISEETSFKLSNSAIMDIFTNCNEDIMNEGNVRQTNGRLSIIWLKRFELKTRKQSQNGALTRVLVVNYNTCHTTLQFIKFCIKHNIVLVPVSCFTKNHLSPVEQKFQSFIKNLAHGLQNCYDKDKKLQISQFLQVYNNEAQNCYTESQISNAFAQSNVWPVQKHVTEFGNFDDNLKAFDYIDLKNKLASIDNLDLSKSQEYESHNFGSLFANSKSSVSSSGGATDTPASSLFSDDEVEYSSYTSSSETCIGKNENENLFNSRRIEPGQTVKTELEEIIDPFMITGQVAEPTSFDATSFANDFGASNFGNGYDDSGFWKF